MIFLTILLSVSLIGNLVIYKKYKNIENNYITAKNKLNFELLSPSIAWVNAEGFVKLQKNYSVNYTKLKKNISSILKKASLKGHYGVYFEDLNTGAWIGINEKDEFLPASLLKLPIMIAILKKVQNGDLSLEQNVTLAKQDIDLQSGSLGFKGEGFTITIKELLTYLVKESDNTAATVLLNRFLTAKDWAEVLFAVGLSPEVYEDKHVTINPKEYSNILRSLYYSTYLNRIFSELCLSIMSNTEYNKQLPAGLPADIRMSHKYGEYSYRGRSGYNDCGIVYVPNKPYIISVMSIGINKNEAEMIIREISKAAYDFVSETQKEQ